MRLEFKPQAFDDLQYWVRHQPKLAKCLIEETQRDPFGGIGKPEPLKTGAAKERAVRVVVPADRWGTSARLQGGGADRRPSARSL